MKNIKIQELQAKYTGNKSYYHKAFTIETDTKIYLFSYSTNVAIFDKLKNIIINTWNGYSKTTAKHISDFCLQLGDTNYTKKEWEKLYDPTDKICLYDLNWNELAEVKRIINKQDIHLEWY